MFTALALMLSFTPTALPAAIDPPSSQLVAYERANLQERNRKKAQIEREEVVVSNGLFTEYRDLKISAALLNRAFDPANHVAEGFHFDPAKLNKLDMSVSEPFLRDRGIVEVIGVGVSDFTGSSERRLQNILISLERYDGVIIPQGEAFSFNDRLGEVTEAAGYAWERTILNGESAWGIGGGICQVSTNLFRAALNAGLPILERRAHSYVIDKYEPTGLDATIYKGQQDLQFTNDTPGDILIRVVRRDNHLAVFFFGTRDRRVELGKTSHWEGYDERIATGWTRTVKKDALVLDEAFKSNYRGTY